jgi:hypothetical protein
MKSRFLVVCVLLGVFCFTGNVFAGEKKLKRENGKVDVTNMKGGEIIVPSISIGYWVENQKMAISPFASNLEEGATMTVFLDGVWQGDAPQPEYNLPKNGEGLINPRQINTRFYTDEPGRHEVLIQVSSKGKKGYFASTFNIEVPYFEARIDGVEYDDGLEVYRVVVYLNTVGDYISSGDRLVLSHPEGWSFSGKVFLGVIDDWLYKAVEIEMSVSQYENFRQYNKANVTIYTYDGSEYNDLAWFNLNWFNLN